MNEDVRADKMEVMASCFPQEDWMSNGGRRSRCFKIAESPYGSKHVLDIVRVQVRGVLKYRRVRGGYEFLCRNKVSLPTLAKLSGDLAAVVTTCSVRGDFCGKVVSGISHRYV